MKKITITGILFLSVIIFLTSLFILERINSDIKKRESNININLEDKSAIIPNGRLSTINENGDAIEGSILEETHNNNEEAINNSEDEPVTIYKEGPVVTEKESIIIDEADKTAKGLKEESVVDNMPIIDHQTLVRPNHSPGEINNWETYLNEIYEFQIKFPSDWTLDDSIDYQNSDGIMDNKKITHLHKTFFYEDYGYKDIFLIIEANDNSDSKSAKDIADQYFNSLPLADYKLERRYILKFKGLDLETGDIFNIIDENNFLVAFLVRNDLRYKITLGAEINYNLTERIDVHMKDLHKILSTLEFLD